MNAYYTAQELADLKVKVLPNTKKGVIARAKKENWQSRPRQGRGGGKEYAFDSLPKDVQDEIKMRTLRAMMPKMSKTTINRGRDVASLDEAQRKTADARLMMANLVGMYEDEMGRTRAIAYISTLSRQNALPVIHGVDYNQVCDIAIACNNKQKTGVGTRKLHQWVLDSDKCQSGSDVLSLLAPAKQGRPVMNVAHIDWLPYFLAVYRNPKGLVLSRAYEEFAFEYSQLVGASGVPSLTQVRHAFNKLPKLVQMRGRVTGSRYKQLQSYVKRNWNPEWMFANDVWVGDGHAMKIKVAHPIHGSDFMPEITIIMDAASRFIVGWSLGLSESHLAVADALRYAMTRHGVPAIYYSDNGSGQSNDVMDNELTGILPRLGVVHATGIAGNPQGRGIIERAMKEVPNRIEQRFETYFGAGSDKETVRKNLYAVASFSRAKEKGKADNELSAIQKRGKKILPGWNELMAVAHEEVERYNNFHYHNAIKATPAACRDELIAQMQSQNEDIVPLSDIEARDLYRPAFNRTVERGRIRYLNQSYGSEALEFFDGQTVVIYVDIHDASSVIVRDGDGKYICDAKLDWKTCDAFPQTYVENARAKRQSGVKRRAQEKIDRIEAENRKLIEHDNKELFGRIVDATWSEVCSDDDDDIILYEHQALERKVM